MDAMMDQNMYDMADFDNVDNFQDGMNSPTGGNFGADPFMSAPGLMIPPTEDMGDEDPSDREIRNLIDFLKMTNASHEQIMTEVQPYISKAKPMSSKGEEMLEKFIHELIQRTQMQQQDIQGNPM